MFLPSYYFNGIDLRDLGWIIHHSIVKSSKYSNHRPYYSILQYSIASDLLKFHSFTQRCPKFQSPAMEQTEYTTMYIQQKTIQ